MARTALTLLGGTQARQYRSATGRPFPTRKAAALTAFLAVEHRMRHSRNTLADLLWGDVAPSQARHSLRQALMEVRSTLGDVLITVEDTVALDLDQLRVDTLALERCLARGSVRALRTACLLYGGDFLAGLTLPEIRFETWRANQRVRLRQLAIEAYERYLTALLASADDTQALAFTLRLLALEPLHEGAHQTIIGLYAGRGQFGAAMLQYDSLARTLKDHLGVEPDHKTQNLLRSLLRARQAS